MKISLDWLNTYLDRPTNADEAQRILTGIGLPLESVEEIGSDFLLDVEVTSNRGDCLSHVGIARELAAATGRKLMLPPSSLRESSPPVNTLTQVENRDVRACPLYTARVITGVKIAPSPPWLVQRLTSIGLRPVNNVVDVTNFVLHESGQPLHAFDLAGLAQRRVVVRRAADGEKFTAIDGSKHTLKSSMLVIADAHEPKALAGIMGGAQSEVTTATTQILLESARFDPLTIRRASRALGLASDSSYRFERGVDPFGVDRASRRAAQLIVEVAGGQLASDVISTGQPLPAPAILQLRPERCNALLGYDLPPQLMVQWLAALGLTPQLEGDAINCTVPSHRLDLRREVDLIEEIARLHGYDHIPVEPKMKIIAQRLQGRVQARQAVARVLTAHGYCETITFSFLAPRLAQPFLAGRELVTVDEQKHKAEPGLRPSLLPSLLACRKANQDAGNRNVRLFEAAQTFARAEGRYVEHHRLAMLADADDPDSLRALRGTLEELLTALGHRGQITISPSSSGWAEPAANISVGAKNIGTYGLANPHALKLFDIQSPVALAELDYEALIAAFPPRPVVQPLPRFPGIERDLSLIVDEPIAWESIAAIIHRLHPPLLEHVEFVTNYRGKPIPPGRKSVTLRMTFRDPQRTLKSEEVNDQVDAVIAATTKELNGQVRV